MPQYRPVPIHSTAVRTRLSQRVLFSAHLAQQVPCPFDAVEAVYEQHSDRKLLRTRAFVREKFAGVHMLGKLNLVRLEETLTVEARICAGEAGRTKMSVYGVNVEECAPFALIIPSERLLTFLNGRPLANFYIPVPFENSEYRPPGFADLGAFFNVWPLAERLISAAAE